MQHSRDSNANRSTRRRGKKVYNRNRIGSGFVYKYMRTTSAERFGSCERGRESLSMAPTRTNGGELIPFFLSMQREVNKRAVSRSRPFACMVVAGATRENQSNRLFYYPYQPKYQYLPAPAGTIAAGGAGRRETGEDKHSFEFSDGRYFCHSESIGSPAFN